MIFRGKKVLRDREAGLVFDWRTGHGSFGRMLLSFVLVSLLCGVLYAYIRVEGPEPRRLLQQGAAVTEINIDKPANRWFAELIERESPFMETWDVRDDSRLDEELAKAMTVLTEAEYVPVFDPLPELEEVGELESLPGASSLPEPEAVAWPKVARRPGSWWLEFEAPDFEWSDFSAPWIWEGEEISSGKTWSFLVGLDAAGSVVSHLELEGKGDPLMRKIFETVKGAPFPAEKDAEEIRWWKVVAVAVNRNEPQKTE